MFFRLFKISEQWFWKRFLLSSLTQSGVLLWPECCPLSFSILTVPCCYQPNLWLSDCHVICLLERNQYIYLSKLQPVIGFVLNSYCIEPPSFTRHPHQSISIWTRGSSERKLSVNQKTTCLGSRIHNRTLIVQNADITNMSKKISQVIK